MLSAITTGAIGYCSTWLCTNVPPERAASFFILTCLIDQIVAPWIAQHLEEYRDDPLTPLFGQTLHIVLATTTANLICHGLHIGLSTTEAALVTGWMLVAALTTFIFIRMFRNIFLI